ncbi:MAG: GDP-L-fucose synthase family protein [Candidatus Micrarchaeaceae archaeon]
MIENLRNKNILVTGGNGFLGSNVVDSLIKHGASKNKIKIPDSKTEDLRVLQNCKNVSKNVDIVIHLAAKVGGIGFNQKYPGELFYDNLMMGAQLMEVARQEGVEKFVAIGTVCAYPKITPVPFMEKNLWDGYPEETNAPYGLAKKMLLVQAQAYRKQYGFNAIYLLPVNLYGIGDNFNPDSSHVIPALIKKVYEARENGKKFIEVWGTGTPTREFLNVKDAAEGIVLATQKYNSPEPVNLGYGKDISIKELVELICRLMEFHGEIKFNKTKPDGQPRRLLDISRSRDGFGFKPKITFEEGLRETIDWYIRTKKKEHI